MGKWNQARLVWLKRHFLRAHPVPFLYSISSSTAIGAAAWSFSGSQVLASFILLILEIYLSDSTTSITAHLTNLY